MKSVLRRLAQTSAMALIASTAPIHSASAQDNPNTNPSGTDPAPIIVTGSRLKQTEQPIAPVLTLDSQDFIRAGTINLTDFLAGYPALLGSSTSSTTAGSSAPLGTTGINLLNLRNLGEKRTLVLINGRRRVGSLPGTAAIDINTIPTELIKRVEIMTGGASAIYGADAVSGVVNFIMREDFSGIAANAHFGRTDSGGAGQFSASAIAGGNFHDGRGNITASFQYSHEQRLEAAQRRHLDKNNRITFQRNPDNPVGADPLLPIYVPLGGVRFADSTRGGGIDFTGDGIPDVVVNPDGSVTAFNPGQPVPPAYQLGGSGTPIADYSNDLLPQNTRYVANITGHYDVSDQLTLFAEANYANIQSFSLGQPTFDYFLAMQPDNAFIPAALQPIAQMTGGLLMNRDNFDLGQRGEKITRKTINTVLGARGSLSEHLNYELSYTAGRTRIANHHLNDQYDDRFYAAIDAVDEGQFLSGAPNGNIVCRASLVPGYVPFQPYVTLYNNPPIREVRPISTFDPADCQPLNLFGENHASAEALAFISGKTTDYTTISQHVVSAQLSGDTGGFLRLPAGPAEFAIGAEFRSDRSRFTPDPFITNGLTFQTSLAGASGHIHVLEGFGEVRLPVLADLPLAHRLDLSGALRVADYSTIGTATTWMLGTVWAPSTDVALSGSLSRAIRAPAIAEAFASRMQTFARLTDPCNYTELDHGSSYRRANCASLLTSLGVADPSTFLDTRSSSLPGTIGGNPDLGAETARSWTAGIHVTPQALPGLNIRADWYNIRLNQAISSLSAQQTAQLCVDQPSLDNPFCSLIERSAVAGSSGRIADFTLSPQNMAQFRTSGLDLDMQYRLPTASLGVFQFRAIGHYLNSFKTIPTPGAAVIDNRGEQGLPKYQMRFDLSWQQGPLALGYRLSWFSKTGRYSNADMASSPNLVADEYKQISTRHVHDISASVMLDSAAQIYGGITNLTNQKPAPGLAAYPVSATGRAFYLGARMQLK